MFKLIFALVLGTNLVLAAGTDYRQLKPEINFENTIAFARRDESSAATVNALITTKGYVKLTATVATINGALEPATTFARQLLISNATGSDVTINHESLSAGAANRFSLPHGIALRLVNKQSASFIYDHGVARWILVATSALSVDPTACGAGDFISAINDDGTVTCSTPAGGSASISAVFKLTGAIVPFTSIDGPHYQMTAVSLTDVRLSLLNSGVSGSTVVRVNQYRAGAFIASETASLASASSAPAGGNQALTGTLSLLVGDIVTVDVVSAAPGADDLTIEF